MNAVAIEKCVKAIDRAKKLRHLNMFLKETFDGALTQVKSNNGKLGNKLMTIKDNFATKDVETTCGSKILREYLPPFNATVVQKLFDAGSVMLGKTNMDEFGMGSVSSSFQGPVVNPWNLKIKPTVDSFHDQKDWYISGGSSGGSAATVTADIAEFSIGSDTGGSVRNPASLCGCVGYKPTYGLISRFGLIPLNNYFDTVGVLSKSVETIVDVINQVAGPDQQDATTIKEEFTKYKLHDDFNISNLTFGIPKEFSPEGLTDCNYTAWQQTIQLLSKLGKAKIVETSLPHTPYSMSCYSILTSCEVASNFARYDGIRYGYRPDEKLAIQNKQGETFESLLKKTRDYGFGNIVKGRIASGNYFLLKQNYEKYFIKAQQVRRLIKEDFDKVYDTSGVDIILTPTCFNDTQTYAEYLNDENVFDEKDFFTACANIAGVPAVSMPASLSKQGLPVGVQFIANVKNDELLLNVANWFSKNNSSNFNSLNLNV